MSLASQIRDTGNCFRQTPPAKKPKKRIPPMSKKRERENKEYLRLRKEFLGAHPYCEACQIVWSKWLPVHPATDVHHMEGRGVNFLRVEMWLPVCRKCHRWIHDNPSEARRLGLLK